MDIKNYFKNFFKSRRIGWYICLGSAPLLLVTAVIYRLGYSGMDMQRFFSVPSYVVLYITMLLCVTLSVVRPVEKWTPLAVFALTLCSFCLFANGTYMYLSSVFFAGVTAEALASLNVGFTATVILQFVIMIVALVALFLPHDKKQNTAAEPTGRIVEPAEGVKAAAGDDTTEA